MTAVKQPPAAVINAASAVIIPGNVSQNDFDSFLFTVLLMWNLFS
jgi:hypothetical protein